ncbi:hypothetical protein DY000_02008423 [Brassica cretica]|uniref:Uncharacterized protein n=1 Tax=Brassica cretica TaxID=69181 RepID=A0ABQ7BUS2_BRACR|nr:hypothetical protein DY000_02008423 [Brassica cretica]
MAFSHYKVANHKSPKALESDFSQEKLAPAVAPRVQRLVEQHVAAPAWPVASIA